MTKSTINTRPNSKQTSTKRSNFQQPQSINTKNFTKKRPAHYLSICLHLIRNYVYRTEIWKTIKNSLFVRGERNNQIYHSTTHSNASQLTFEVIHFAGHVPVTLGNLRDLQLLDLSYNDLSDTFSSSEINFLSSLVNFNDLRFLGFRGNSLITGYLPASIRNLSVSLQYFFASGCKISGSIPGEIGNLTNLVILDLSRNNLVGSILTTFTRLKHIQRLHLSTNFLRGPPN